MPIRTRTRVVQVMLAVLLLIGSGVISVPAGHGGFLVGQLVLFGPIFAAAALVVTACLLVLAWFVTPGILAICTTILAAPALVFFLMVSERRSWTLASASFFIGVWVIITLRGVWGSAIVRKNASS